MNFIYKLIYMYILKNFSIFFIYGIYKYIGKLYWIATNGVYSIFKIDQERAWWKTWWDFKAFYFWNSDLMIFRPVKNEKPIDWYIGLVCYSILITQDYWFMYWAYYFYEYFVLQKNWVYWVKGDLIILLNLAFILFLICLFIYVVTVFVIYVVEPLYNWILNIIKVNNLIDTKSKILFILENIFFFILRCFKKIIYVYKNINKKFLYKNYLIILTSLQNIFNKVVKRYNSIVYCITQLFGIFKASLIFISSYFLILISFILYYLLFNCIYEYFLLKVLPILYDYFFPFIKPFILLFKWILILLRIVVNNIKFLLIPLLFVISYLWNIKWKFKFYSTGIYKSLYKIYIIRNLINTFHKFHKDLNYDSLYKSSIYIIYKKIINNYNIIFILYFELNKLFYIFKRDKKKWKLIYILLKKLSLLNYMFKWVFLKKKIKLNNEFLKWNSKSLLNIKYYLIKDKIYFYYTNLKASLYNKILSKYLLYYNIYSLTILLILKISLIIKKYYEYLGINYYATLSYYLDIIDSYSNFKLLKYYKYFNKNIKPVIIWLIKLIYNYLYNLLYNLIKFLFNIIIKLLKVIFVNNIFYYSKRFWIWWKWFHNERRTNYTYMLNLLYLNVFLKPLPLLIYIWNYFMIEEIIAIEHPIPILISKVVFLIIYLLCCWAVLFMHIYMESSKNTNFELTFRTYRRCLTVRIINFAVVTIFLSAIILFITESWIGDGYYYEPETFEPFSVYGNIKGSKCIICASLFILAKISIYLYCFIYWLCFKSLSVGKVNYQVFKHSYKELEVRTTYLRWNDKTTFDFRNEKESYNIQLLVRIVGLILGIIILYLLAYFFCNVIVYKVLAVKPVYI
jgi:hypothetical protein